MGDDKSEEKQKSAIKLAISTTIENTNKDLVSMLTKFTSSISNTLIDNTTVNVISKQGGGNIWRLEGVVVQAGGVINNNQTTDLKNTIESIIAICKDQNAIDKITNDVLNQVKEKITENTQLQQNMKATASATDSDKESGEINSLISSLTSLFATKGDQTTEADVDNAFNTTLKTTNINDTDVKDLMSTFFNDKVDSKDLLNVVAQTSTFNEFDMKNVVVYGTVNNTQKIATTNFINSFVNQLIKLESTKESAQKSQSDTDNGIDDQMRLKNEADAAAAAEKLKQTTSLIDSLLNMIIIAVVGVVIVVIVFMFLGPQLMKGFSNMKGKLDKKGKLGKVSNALDTVDNVADVGNVGNVGNVSKIASKV